jgi:Na+/H+ antiporter NhaA
LSQFIDPAIGGEPTTARQKVVRSLVRPVQAFISEEVLSGVILLVAAIAALIWANSPWDGSYHDLFTAKLYIHAGSLHFDEDVRHWINDGLMAVFFFVVGLEIKRELLRGELAGLDKAILPAVAAAGGMIVPALIYTAVNAGGDGGRGWGIPMATDLAFALGVLALLGNRVPPSVRVFLLALAIVDDIGSIAVISIFYSGDIDFAWLAAAVVLFAGAFALRHALARHYFAFAIAGMLVWLAVFQSGLSTTLVGVALGLMTPLDPVAGGESAVERLESFVHPFDGLLIVPLFALANAGLDLSSGSLTHSVTSGVVVARVVGKPIGIVFASWVVVRLGLASLPNSMRWVHLLGVGVLGGIGFTVALLVNEIAFGGDPLANDGKLGIIVAALIAGTLGLAVLMLFGRAEPGSAATGK